MHSPDMPAFSFGALLAGQMRAVGLALSREAVLAGALLASICLLSLAMALRYQEDLNFAPELLQPALLVALLLPFAVWKGDSIFGRAYLWTLPVRRQRAAAAKILAGGLWLMLAMLVTAVSLALVACASGGRVGDVDTLLVGATPAQAIRTGWATPLWMWVMPFTSAFMLYLLSSAMLLGLRHPIRWTAGVLVGATMLSAAIGTLAPEGVLEYGLGWLRHAIWSGCAGLDFALTGGSNTLTRHIDKPGPGWDILWRSLPEFGRWAWATCVWLGLALLAVALAMRRHWER